MDGNRAREIMRSPEPIRVLYEGEPVWLENVKNNNVAEVTRLEDRQIKMEVPVYLLVENTPANQ